MASSSNSWIPHGRHEVQIGPSLNRALKARKGGPPPPAKRTGPPEKDFYSFRYNFKPPSVDTTKPGTIEVSRGKDATTVSVEHPSAQPGESHIYNGNETTAKELDCVLIYDEETGSYKLEKLESYIVLAYERKKTTSLPPSAAPSPAKVDNGIEDQLQYSLQDADGESEGEMPNNFAVPQEEEEEEDGEFEEVLPSPPPPPPAKPAKAPPPPKQRPEPVVAPRPTKPAPQRRTTKKAPPSPPVRADVGADAEVLDFGRPPVKRARRSRSPVAFSLPGSSTSTWVPPPAPAPQQPKAPSPPASPIAVASDSDSDDWDEVSPVPIAPAAEEAPQEIDLNDFELTLEAEMEAEMEDDQDEEGSEQEDFLVDAIPQAPDSAVPPPRLLSMGQLAGYSDDEYSSSEDSDDD
ncbi:RNA polymerase II transcription elongation factor-domain-containing protein [Mycena maculata]|uniref:RNA polymerase II transcription elongation factor-domain-containing protein n=1 Tax=Mycena maculata TaxID=230809 RepID=A0AAD7NIN4_9AGAR|nr:RNA polymerase II transcription elongation factor-domain-containing protein [Mycena maculata]